MSRIRIDVDVLDATIEQMVTLCDALNDELKAVQSLTKDLRNYWDGAAVEAFETATTLWIRDAKASITELNRLKIAATTTRNNWTKAFDADTAMWG
ncbi:hypothetical protein GOARA_031_00220 [Gordonia araii NBRC 100433]|uniref:ESAT-6-like protein n=1 Tax=Gordonia araii NBRC 100433 TaxID=1073574 RepID=G7H022_9ACTN|nr:WXG100 family type VII secretion target [Gordonia araii]NNG98796.1 WXG100 family type VII secretion target [Gordonia araii NBRC 100433]GAB09197.1 hypothetical protein GOARA_031_00220 [Gordonia araii NBRC 100433]